jgi:hypothetical protein
MAMDKEERRFFERMSKALEEMTKAQERVADVMEKQQPSKANQVLTMLVAGVTVAGVVNVVDLIIRWIKRG